MAEDSKSKSRRLKSQTVRERADTASTRPEKPRRLRKTAGVAATTAAKPFKAAQGVREKNYGLPVPKNRIGRFASKRRHFIPSYFRNAWKELVQVKWPNRRETIKLTVAVITFALAFALLIGIVDYGLDKIFKKILL